MATLRRIAAFLCAALFAVCIASPTLAAMSSTNYQILWDAVGAGGEDTATSSSYNLRDSIGDTAIGTGTSTNYIVSDGYGGDIFDRTVNFRVLGMQRSYQVGATSVSGTTVTVTTTTGYSEGSYIALIQDEGASQVSAVGRIVTVTSTTLAVDEWSTNGTMPAIDGADDVVYLLNTGAATDLGTLSTSDVSTALLAWVATADVAQGYSVYLMADHDLQSTISSSTVLTSVSDGTVSAGATEYGARSSDTSLALSTFDTQDTAITTSLQQVASRNDNSYRSRDFLTLKAAVASGATSANYSQSLSVIFVGDY